MQIILENKQRGIIKTTPFVFCIKISLYKIQIFINIFENLFSISYT